MLAPPRAIEVRQIRHMVAQPFVIQIKVKPNARARNLERAADGTWLAQLKAAPVDDKANEELIALVAERF